MYKRGVPGELACVCCFELNCFGCSVFARALSLETMENLPDYAEEGEKFQLDLEEKF